jgi:BMFP domain-containing protein YqiC
VLDAAPPSGGRSRLSSALGKGLARDHISPEILKEKAMQTRNKVLDDVAQLFSNAMGVAQGARAEAETAFKGMLDRWLADRNFVTREEFDAVRSMAQKAREENDALRARIEKLEGGAE